ncbi:Homologous-pairing protein 2 -like protein [Halotydeus destructor]|nr:Homologous-pairing protein 2 -like protein [Halotydeus destructor]
MGKEADAETIILNYLKKNNRPYSVNDVHNNLQKVEGLSKPTVQKAVDGLVIQQKIKEKIYGKQKIFYVDQETLQSVSSEDVNQLDQVIEKNTLELNSTNSLLKQKESALSEFKKEMSLKEIRQKIAELDDENSELKSRLVSIKEKNGKFDPKENEKILKERNVLVKEWRKRKRMANGLLDAILEGYPNPKKQLLEEIGVETDEDNNVVLPTD